jgi:hypothetical protein
MESHRKESDENPAFDDSIYKEVQLELESVLSLKAEVKSMSLSDDSTKDFLEIIETFYKECFQSGIELEALTRIISSAINIERKITEIKMEKDKKFIQDRYNTLKERSNKNTVKAENLFEIKTRSNAALMKLNMNNESTSESANKELPKLNLNLMGINNKSNESDNTKIKLNLQIKSNNDMPLSLTSENNFVNKIRISEKSESGILNQLKKNNENRLKKMNEDKKKKRNKKLTPEEEAEENRRLEVLRKGREALARKEKESEKKGMMSYLFG